jgi:ribosomal protein S3AE
MKYTIDYQPEISETCKTYINNNLTPTFSNDYTSIFNTLYVIDKLQEEIDHAGEEVFGIKNADINKLKRLEKQDIPYIELTN